MTPLFALTAAIALGQPTDADRLFAEGQELTADAARARPKFAEAARAYDGAWRNGERSAGVAANRGRAHALAGDIAGAVAAAHAGLRVEPSDRELQRDLETYRDAVAYPAPSRPNERTRPDPPAGWQSRVRGIDLFWLAAASSLAVVVGVARRFTARDDWAVPLSIIGAVGLLVVGGVLWQLNRERTADAEKPVAILRGETPLLRGNGATHPRRLDAPLPRGGEVRVLFHRGGWAQVELPGGAVGWVPDESLLPVE